MPRTAVVTGANRGVGLEFTRQLLARGDRVVASCRHPGKATELNALVGHHPGRLHVLPLDVASPDSRAAFLAELPLALGEEARIDLLINNAGVLHSGERFGQLQQATLEDSLRVNAIAPLLLAQALAPLLRDGV
uniref:SDR family NAD(P)-dependent oxidoreductase n=1 Tax=Thermomonas sp. TaxID=1971895 RepID=UPI002623BA10